MRHLVLFPFQLNKQYLEVAHVNMNDRIYILETKEQLTRYPYHQNRLVLHMSAARHFVSELKEKGYQVDILTHDTVDEALNGLDACLIFYPTDDEDIALLKDFTHITFYEDPLFIVSNEDWKRRLNKKPWKMDTVYRKLRQELNILMENAKPIGGKYSFDGNNRKPYKKGLSFHEPLMFLPDDITNQCIDIVQAEYAENPGTTKNFQYPVTRAQALEAMEHFMSYRLATFGDHQDVMIEHMPWMSHSLLSSSINLGLLSPIEVIQAAVEAYNNGLADIAPVEGFIRQILGWREYVRGVYLMTPSYELKNELSHHLDLPSLYWDATTDLNCLHHVVSETIEYGYNHHIQRLMVLSNFANLIRVHPKALRDWFNIMYIDSFDWIVAPNVIGMGLYADGGMMSTKPYISSGAYIHKMSNYCQDCIYDPKIKTGPKACPFNALYWGFIQDHETLLKSNPRMSMMYQVLSKMDVDMKKQYMNDMEAFIRSIQNS
ncbi:MAG: cryptochrome/photolyase family protein [Acholeplasmataceae bacterium]